MNEKQRPIPWKTCLRVGISAFVLFLCITCWDVAAGILSALFQAVLPILIGGVIAYLVNILMAFYERHYFPNRKDTSILAKTRRPVCMIAAIVTLIAVVALVVILVVPEFAACVETLVQKAPEAVETLLANPAIARLVPEDMAAALSGLNWEAIVSQAVKVLQSGLAGVTDTVSSVFSGIVCGVFSVIFAVYILLGKDKICRQCDRLARSCLRPAWREKLSRALSLLNQCFHKYIVGQCIEALILGSLCALGMLLFQFPYALMIGALVGITALIPVAGAYIGAGVGAFMILSVSPSKALLFLVFILLLQQVEGNLIYPRVVGGSIGLPAILVLAAVTVGGALFGMAGMLVSVPITAAAYSALQAHIARKERPLPEVKKTE